MTKKADKLVQALKDLSETKATYGYQGKSGDEPHPDNPDLSVKDLATIHEFGLGVPARPLVRVTADTNKEAFKAAAKKAAKAVAMGAVRDRRGRFAGRDIEAAVQPVAELGLSALRATLRRSRQWAEPNAESTIEAKGHDQPLVGTEKSLHNNASWGIVRGRRIVRQGGEQ